MWGIAAVVGLGLIGNALNGFAGGTSPVSSRSVSPSPTALASPPPFSAETKAPNTPSTPESEISLASQVDERLRNALQVENYTDGLVAADADTSNPLFYIASIADVSAGTVRVVVQADIAKSEAKLTGNRIFTLVGQETPELRIVVIRGTDGKDVNVYRPST